MMCLAAASIPAFSEPGHWVLATPCTWTLALSVRSVVRGRRSREAAAWAKVAETVNAGVGTGKGILVGIPHGELELGQMQDRIRAEILGHT
jgi:hypothetical protein